MKWGDRSSSNFNTVLILVVILAVLLFAPQVLTSPLLPLVLAIWIVWYILKDEN